MLYDINEELKAYLQDAPACELSELAYEYVAVSKSEMDTFNFATTYFGVNEKTLTYWCEFVSNGVYSDIRECLYYTLIDLDFAEILEIANYAYI